MYKYQEFENIRNLYLIIQTEFLYNSHLRFSSNFIIITNMKILISDIFGEWVKNINYFGVDLFE